jgi:hypothetical protein
MRISFLFASVLAVSGLEAAAQEPVVIVQPTIVVPASPLPKREAQVEGSVISRGPNQFTVQTKEGRRVPLFVSDRTLITRSEKAVPLADLDLGTPVTAWYTTDGDRFWAFDVIVVTALPPGIVAISPPRLTNSNTAYYDSDVTPIVSTPPLVIRTSDVTNVDVDVTPETTSRVRDIPGGLSAIQPNAPVLVEYDVRDGRPYARVITSTPRP